MNGQIFVTYVQCFHTFDWALRRLTLPFHKFGRFSPDFVTLASARCHIFRLNFCFKLVFKPKCEDQILVLSLVFSVVLGVVIPSVHLSVTHMLCD